MSLKNWPARRGVKPVTDEARLDAEWIERGTDQWRRWWRGDSVGVEGSDQDGPEVLC